MSTAPAYVSLVTLGVADVERAAAFYAAWGWRRSPASVAGTVAFMLGGAVPLSLFGRDDLAREAAAELPAPAGAAGAVADWGGYTGYARDPDGHLWEVAHNPGFALGEDGRVTLPG